MNNLNESKLCSICGDPASGNNYGVVSCVACTEFFRRSIRKKQVLESCALHSCLIDKNKHKSCKYCRLEKCFLAGMKQEVQEDRGNASRMWPINSGLSLTILLNAEESSRKMTQILYGDVRSKKVANISDVCEAMKQELCALISWATAIPAFCQLEMDEQVALLKAHTDEQLCLTLARRSIHLKDALLLGNKFVIPRQSQEIEISKIGCRIMDELITTVRETQVDDNEFACLKAILFFDPYVKGISDSYQIKGLQDQVLTMLEDISGRKHCRGRLGRILLLFTSLARISRQMIQQIHSAQDFRIANIDDILQELLQEGAYKRSSVPQTSMSAPSDFI